MRIVRRGRRHGNYTLRGTPDQITLPAGTMTMAVEEKKEEGDEEEAVGDSLHLLSPFVLVHNKGSVSTTTTTTTTYNETFSLSLFIYGSFPAS